MCYDFGPSMARNVNLSGGNHEGMQVSQIGQKEDLFRRDVHLQRTLHQLVLFEHRVFSVLAPIHLIQVENRMKQKCVRACDDLPEYKFVAPADVLCSVDALSPAPALEPMFFVCERETASVRERLQGGREGREVEGGGGGPLAAG